MTIGIRGLGLIGGSFEKAFLQAGYDTLNLKDATPDKIRSCEIIIVCLPPLMVAPWIQQHANDFADNAIITDAAGVKGVVCDALYELAKKSTWTYIGGHPMAGKERSGYKNATADLFKGSSMILTPYPFTPLELVEHLKTVFTNIGFARCVITTPAHHDKMIAYTSQLAHVVSSAYVQDALSQSHFGFSAGSYQDMTRVATVDPDIWTDLFLSNSQSLDAVLTRLIDRLDKYKMAIRSGDASALRELLSEGQKAKESAK